MRQIAVKTSPVVESVPKAVSEPSPPSRSHWMPRRTAAPSNDGTHGAPIAVDVDSERRQISLRMSYLTAIICVCAVLVVVMLAMIIGQHINHAPTALFGQNNRDLINGPAHGEVLDVHPNTPIRHVEAHDSGAVPRQAAAIVPPTLNESRAPATMVIRDSNRSIGLNYVVVQSYADEKSATEARDFLNNNGVPCTIEHNLHGWPKTAFIVIGIDGFAHISSYEYKDYTDNIKRLSLRFAPPTPHSQHNYKAFEPAGYQWGQGGEAAAATAR